MSIIDAISDEMKNSSSLIPIITGLPFFAAIISLGLSSFNTMIPYAPTIFDNANLTDSSNVRFSVSKNNL